MIGITRITECMADHNVFPVSARSLGMGSVCVMLNGPWSGLHNQAGLAMQQELCFAFHYENRFLVPEMGQGVFTMCFPTRTGTIAMNYTFYGFAHYNESRTGLAFGKSFGDKFQAGIELNYLRVHQYAGYGNLHSVIPGIGFQVKPLKNIIIAFHVFNPANQGFSNKRSERILSVVRAGTGYLMGEEVLVCFEIEKRSGYKAVYSTGMEYDISDLLQIRIGLLYGEYACASFGLGIRLKSLHIDVAAQRHPVLGYSQAISISCALGNPGTNNHLIFPGFK